MSERERLIAAISARLNRINATGDRAHVLEQDAVTEVTRLLSLVDDPEQDLEAAHVAGWLHWERYQALPEDEDQADLQAAAELLFAVYEVSPDDVPTDMRDFYRHQESADDSQPRQADSPELYTRQAVELYEDYQQTDDQNSLTDAVLLFRRALAAIPPDHPDRAMYLNNLGFSLQALFDQAGEPDVLIEAITLGRDATASPDHPEHALHLFNLACALQTLLDQTEDLDVLIDLIEVSQELVDATPADDPERAMYLSSLGSSLQLLFEQTGERAVLTEAIAVGREAVATTLPDDPDRPAYLNNLVAALQNLFEWTGERAVLTEAIAIGREAVATTPPDHPVRAGCLSNLGYALRTLFGRNGKLEVLTEAIAVGREAVATALPNDPDHAAYLNNLGGSLRILFERTGETALLTEAIAIDRDAVAATPTGHPDRATHVSTLGSALLTLFERTGELEVLTEAIAIGREAVTATPPDHPNRARRMSSLGNTLQALFERTGETTVLTEAIAVYREAVTATPADHPDRATYLSNLGNALQALFERTGELETLTEAIAVGRDAVAATPADHPGRATYLSNLGNALRALFGRIGELETLTEAIAVGRDAVAATPPDHPDRAVTLSNLGNVLQALFERTGELEVLTEAIVIGREAVAATPPDHPNRATYLNLGNALHILFERTGELETLTEAIAIDREAVAATPPDHPNRAAMLSNLGGTLHALFGRTGELETLTEAIAVGRDAVAATPPDHPNRAMLLSNLGSILHTLFGRTGELEVLTEAVTIGRDAVTATPSDHPDRARTLSNLGLTLHTLFDQTGELEVLTEARQLFAEAAESETAPVLIRLDAGRQLGSAARSAGESTDALAAYEKAIALLPRLAPRRLGRADREHGLGEMAELAAEAASTAIEAGRPGRAVELLELARGVLLGEIMAARSDLSELRAHSPELATRFERLRDDLDAADHDSPTPSMIAIVESVPSNTPGLPPEIGAGHQNATTTAWAASHEAARMVAVRRRELAQEWDELLTRIRSIGGLEQFLLPPPIDHLRRLAADGPIALVNVSYYRCDALILTSDAHRPVHLVELPGLTRGAVIDQVERFVAATTAAGSGSIEQRRAGQQEIHGVLHRLWDEITAPVLRDLGLTGPPDVGQAWPRLWWCPVAAMTFLPLHAAGRHTRVPDDDAPSDVHQTVMDRVVSSYTPTIRALGYARDRAASTTSADSDGPRTAALIIALPDTDGAPALPGAHEEAIRLARLLPGSLTLTGAQATREAVLSALPGYPIVHLACHGLSDWDTPAASRLLLHDHTANPLTVTAISRLRLTHADLAYLSACSTTTSNQRLADEAVHITAAFQLAGYQNVIGTLWPINDATAVRIADDIYTRLTENGTAAPAVGQTAHALHHAIRRLRTDYTASPALWAAHIHAGI